MPHSLGPRAQPGWWEGGAGWTADEHGRKKPQWCHSEPATRPIPQASEQRGGPQELTMLALLALQTLPRLFAQLSRPTPFPLPVLRIPLLIVGKAV